MDLWPRAVENDASAIEQFYKPKQKRAIVAYIMSPVTFDIWPCYPKI